MQIRRRRIETKIKLATGKGTGELCLYSLLKNSWDAAARVEPALQLAEKLGSVRRPGSAALQRRV
jgi:hypothetical protein